MRTVLATVGFLAAAIVVLSSVVPTLAKATHSVSLDLRGCFLFCLLADRGGDLFSPQRIPTEITIERYPESWRKRDDLEVAGRVRTPEGAPVSGLTVEVFLNRTKSTPGTLVGTVESDDAGWWIYRGKAPSGLTAGNYQLVARAVEDRRFGTVHLEGWSDPEVSMWSGTRLEPQLRWEEGGWTVEVQLQDDAGKAVPSARLVWETEGRRAALSRTDEAGRATERFAGPGPKRLLVRFEGQSGYEPTEREILLPAPSLALDASVVGAPVGAPAVLRGRTDPGVPVEVDGRPVPVDGAGRFEAALDPRAQAGRYTVLVRAGGTNATAELHVGSPLEVDLSFGRLDLLGATARVTVTSEGRPLAGARVRIPTPEGEVVAVTDADGTARLRLPLPRGTWEVRAEVTAEGHLAQTTEGTARVRGLLDLALVPAAALAAAGAAFLARRAAPLLRPRAGLTVALPARAVAGEPLELQVTCTPPGPVVVEAESLGGGEPRAYRLGTFADPSGAVRLRFERTGPWTLRARRLPTADCRGGEVMGRLEVVSYADALALAGHNELAQRARWDRPPTRRETWERGGRPA